MVTHILPKKRSSTNSAAKVKIYKFAALWVALSIIFLGISYFANSYIQMSRGDINHDGIIDSKDVRILNDRSALNASKDKSGEVTVIQIETPKVSIKNPVTIIHKPVVHQF